MKTRHLLTPFALALLALMGALALLGAWDDELSPSTWFGASVAQAQSGTGVIRVATIGTDTIGCGSVITPCGSLQNAVDQASDGDTIKVAAGTYSDVHTYTWFIDPIYPYSITQVVLISGNITIRGGYTTTDWNTFDPEANPTILDAQEQGRGVYIAAGSTVTLEGLRIVNGRGAQEESGAPDGGGGIGVELYGDTHLTIRNCDILSNTALSGDSIYSSGGGVYFRDGTLTLENSRVVSNTAVSAGGSSGGGVYVRSATVTMTNNLFQDNVSDRFGGGAYFYECTAYVAHNTFQENTAAEDGGGLQTVRGDLLLTDNTLVDNTASGIGGGLYGQVGGAGHAYTITHNLIQDNLAGVDVDDSAGGGAYLTASDGRIVFSHNQVVSNMALDCREQTAWFQGRGGGLYISQYYDSSALVSDNLFQDNWAATGQQCTGVGGGVFVSGEVQLERNRILNNRAASYPDWGIYFPVYGGGVYVHDGGVSRVTMTNNILAGNKYFEEDDTLGSDDFSTGGAIYVGGQTTPTDTQLILLHNTIADNQSPAILNEAAALTMSHNILSGHSVDLETIEYEPYDALPATVADYTLWYPSMDVEIKSGTFVSTDNITGTPDFIDASGGDYHVGVASEAIDRGPGVGVSDDIDGNARPINAAYDLGADEHIGTDLSSSAKYVSPQTAKSGDVVTFTIVLSNSGTSDAVGVTLFDAIPVNTTYVAGSAQATSGEITDTDGITWSGTVPSNGSVVVTFRVTMGHDGSVENVATVTDEYGASTTLTAWVNLRRVYLPLVIRSY